MQSWERCGRPERGCLSAGPGGVQDHQVNGGGVQAALGGGDLPTDLVAVLQRCHFVEAVQSQQNRFGVDECREVGDGEGLVAASLDVVSQECFERRPSAFERRRRPSRAPPVAFLAVS